MSASQVHALSAIAFQLAATLDAYEVDVARMVKGPLDPEQYRKVSAHVDQMRMYAAALPPLSVAWVEVLIRHFELAHGVWLAQKSEEHAQRLPHLHSQLRGAIQSLSRRCVQLMPAA
jgi:hypothetical protein